MPERPRMSLTATVLGCPDPQALGRFYAQLLGWPIDVDSPEWVTLRPGGPALSFQLEDDHVPPTWPQRPGDQQMQAHLDIRVDDLEAAGAFARSLGATLADVQPQEHVRVHLDPAGHPFCLYLG
jgi:catechol 2,3-dioxygenase-like lactoylglutathione lyase family enzyme